MPERLTKRQTEMLALLAVDSRGEGYVHPGTTRVRTAQSLMDRGLLSGDLISRSGGWVKLTPAGRSAAPTEQAGGPNA